MSSSNSSSNESPIQHPKEKDDLEENQEEEGEEEDSSSEESQNDNWLKLYTELKDTLEKTRKRVAQLEKEVRDGRERETTTKKDPNPFSAQQREETISKLKKV